MSIQPAAASLIGIILAAGKGTRMAPFSDRYPKPILPISGKPLLQHQVERLRDLGVRKVIIVIGHLGFEIVRTLGDGSDLGVAIEYVDQGATLGIAHALGKLEDRVDRPFMLFLGDIFFLHDDLGAMVRQLGDGVQGVLAVKEESQPEAIRRNFVVLEDKDGRVTRVIEKPRHPRSTVKGCGLYLFDPVFFDSVRRTPRSAMRDEYEITDAIQLFIDDGYVVKAARVIREDLNLSFPQDLLDINLRVLEGKCFLGEGVTLAPGAQVERSVLMKGVRVTEPITIRDCLVFPEVTIGSRTDLERRIVTPDRVIDCR